MFFLLFCLNNEKIIVYFGNDSTTKSMKNKFNSFNRMFFIMFFRI